MQKTAVECPRCKSEVEAPDQPGTHEAWCPACGHTFTIEARAEDSAPEAAPSAPRQAQKLHGLRDVQRHLKRHTAYGSLRQLANVIRILAWTGCAVSMAVAVLLFLRANEPASAPDGQGEYLAEVKLGLALGCAVSLLVSLAWTGLLCALASAIDALADNSDAQLAMVSQRWVEAWSPPTEQPQSQP